MIQIDDDETATIIIAKKNSTRSEARQRKKLNETI